MLCFALLSGYRLFETGLLYFAIHLLRDVLAAGLFLKRTKAKHSDGSIMSAAVAYISTLFSLVYMAPVGAVSPTTQLVFNGLSIVGFAIATLAVIELGDRFGITPAKRGERCRSGVYAILKHPMYTGYAIAEMGWVLINPLNAPFFVLSLVLYAARVRLEERVLTGGDARRG